MVPLDLWTLTEAGAGVIWGVLWGVFDGTLIRNSVVYLPVNPAVRKRSETFPTLVAIKLLHTAIWLFFATCIGAIFVAGALRRFYTAGILSCLVLVECAVLALNRGRCPLTDLACRYTQERADNFDIYLPPWLARHNKAIFGTLFAAGVVFVAARYFISMG